MNEDSAIDYSSSDKHGQVHSAERPVMVPVGTKRRRVPESQRSLCFILLALKNEEVSIELKNESVVTGTIAECDSAMNVTLVNAHIKSEEGASRGLETVYVAGARILYVHVPTRIRMVQTANNHAQTLQRLSDHKRHRITDSNKQRRLIEAAKHEPIVFSAPARPDGSDDADSYYY